MMIEKAMMDECIGDGPGYEWLGAAVVWLRSLYGEFGGKPLTVGYEYAVVLATLRCRHVCGSCLPYHGQVHASGMCPQRVPSSLRHVQVNAPFALSDKARSCNARGHRLSLWVHTV